MKNAREFAELPGTILVLYVVYQHPRDFPRHVVVRAQAVHTSGAGWNARVACLYDTLEEAQREYEALGLSFLNRAPGDDPVIVGTWL